LRCFFLAASFRPILTLILGLYLFLLTSSPFFRFLCFFINLFSLPCPSCCFRDLCHCYNDIRNTVGVRLMGWQISACNCSNMPLRSSQPASSTLLSAHPPVARCRFCPSLFGTEEVPAYWPSFVRTRAQTSWQQQYFPTCHLLGHNTVSL